ncbi:putative reverse transcriptase domain-containing protein [Tanacetum coccineum]
MACRIFSQIAKSVLRIHNETKLSKKWVRIAFHSFALVCKTSRWKDSNTPGKKVPKKVLRYFLIIPRLQRLYKSSHTVNEMTWHATGKCTEPSKIQYVAGDIDNIPADGFNPFGNLSQAYSMWPVILTTYNLHPWLCMKESSFMPTLLIPGPKSPGKDIDVYLRPLIDDLKVLWALKGVETIDVATVQKFNMRAMELWTINDFPAQSSLSGWSGQCYLACPTCNKDTPSMLACGLAKPKTGSARSLNNICSPGGKDGEMYYGQLQEILEFSYLSFKVVLFRVKWFDTSNEGRKVKHLVLRNNMTQILTKGEAFKDDQYILATQVKQCFYLEDMARRQPHWKVVEHVNHKKFSDGGVIVVEEDPDVIHFDNSSDLPLSTSLNDLDNVTLHIDGQSTEVDAPPDIIDLDEDDDIIDDEDALPHDLADSDDEDLVNVDDDDGVDVMSADVARGHGGDGGSDDRPLTHHIPIGCGGCFANRGTRKPNLGGRKAGRLHTRQETHNLGLKKITDDKGPVPIRFEWDDKKTLMPLGDHASHWSNYLGELIREMPLYYPSWQKVSAERKAAILTKIGTQFDLTPHMQSQHWTDINAGIQQHMQRLYNTNKASLKAAHWVKNPETGTYDVESIRQQRGDVDAAGSRLQHLVGCSLHTDEEINALARKGKHQGYLLGVGRVLPGWATDVLIPPPSPPPQCTHNSGDVEKLKKKNKYLTKQVNLMMKLFRNDNKFSHMLNQYESTPEFGSGSGGCGDDEMADDEDEEDEEDGDFVMYLDRFYIGLYRKSAKNDFSTAMLERKKSPNRLVVDEDVNDDNSVVAMNPTTMEKLYLLHGDTILIKELWQQGTALDLEDPSVGSTSDMQQFLRIVHVALLCVQEDAIDRPTTSDMISMLLNDTISLAPPNKPAFVLSRAASRSTSNEIQTHDCSVNNMTIIVVDGR